MEDDDEVRLRIRQLRREYLLVIDMCHQISFESVKKSEEKERTRGFSFGTNRDREVLPAKASYFDPKFSSNRICEGADSKHVPGWSFASNVARFPEQSVASTPMYKAPDIVFKHGRFLKEKTMAAHGHRTKLPG